MAQMFQVKLGGEWKDYSKNEDKLLKRAFLSGFPNARLSWKDQEYVINFKEMSQKNVRSGKSRQIRAPHKWQAPKEPLSKGGPSTVVKVPKGAAGQRIQVAHPKAKGEFITVAVPAKAKEGQPMLISVPEVKPAAAPGSDVPVAAEAVATPAAEKEAKKGMGVAGKVCLGAGGLAAVGGLAAAGVVLGDHIEEVGWDAAMEDIGEAFEDAGEAIVDGFEDAGEWIVDAAEDAGEWVMDLF